MIKHLALVMDGNRRWAQKQGFKPWAGHQAGAQVIQKVLQFCLQKQIPYVSLYTFSIENFKRSPEELAFLFDMMINEAKKQLPLFTAHHIRVRFIGQRELFPEQIRETITLIEEDTRPNSALQLNLLFCYGGRQDIIGGIKTLVHKIRNAELTLDQISDETFSQCLWTSDMPEPDLIIRTGGVKRLSNFLLYQAAYAELCFLDCLWPEITETDLEQALAQFKSVQRNYGA